jgi:hypothetical protein
MSLWNGAGVGQSKVYPTLANGVQVIGAAGVWTFGNFAVVVPANAIAKSFTIYNIAIEDSVGGGGVFSLHLFAGPDGSEVNIGEVRFCRTGTYGYSGFVPIITPAIPANTQIKAKLASQSGGGQSIVISLYYTYI